MEFNWDPAVILNAVLCIIIFILGFGALKKDVHKTPFVIGLAFGIFGASHVLTILGYGKSLESLLIVIRTFAYLIVLLALYRQVSR